MVEHFFCIQSAEINDNFATGSFEGAKTRNKSIGYVFTEKNYETLS